MTPLSTEQFAARTRELILAESRQLARIWYLSFVNDTGWSGAVLIRAPGLAHAVLLSHALQINPGGEVMGIDYVDDGQIDDADLCRMLTVEDCTRLLGPMKTVGEIVTGGYYFHDKAGEA